MRTSLAAAVLGAALASVGVARPARAAELRLEPPLPCRNEGELAFLAERALGRPLGSMPGPVFVVSMTTQAAGVSARMKTHVDGVEVGVRTFSAASCSELAETLAVAIAIALGGNSDEGLAAVPAASDDERGGAGVRAAPVPVASGAVAVQGAPSAAQGSESSAPVAPAGSSDRPELSALAFGVADSGSLPAAALGVAVGAGMRWSELELRGGALLLPARYGAVDEPVNGDVGADIELLAGWASACLPLSLRAEALELGVCGGWEMGRLQATGTGVVRSYRRSRLWAAPRLDLAARWAIALTPLSLQLLATALVPLRRDEFILRDIGSVHRVANVVARAQVGLAWAFW